MPKQKNIDEIEEKENEDFSKKENKAFEESAWSRDQREKSYYYDDSHGYEIYNPEEVDEEDE